MKNQYVAAFLAFFFGVFGVHRFYLGQKSLGVLYLVSFFVGLMMTIGTDGDFPLLIVPAILAFIDAILLAAMPAREFAHKYLHGDGYTYDDQPETTEEDYGYAAEPGLGVDQAQAQEYKSMGIKFFREKDYFGAANAFQRALQSLPDSPTLSFNLACCYALLNQSAKALQYLDAAVAHGFDNWEKIHLHFAFNHLRHEPEFKAFVRNGYRLPSTAPASDLLATFPQNQPAPVATKGDVLDELLQLGELKEKGLITEEEFLRQKQKLLHS